MDNLHNEFEELADRDDCIRELMASRVRLRAVLKRIVAGQVGEAGLVPWQIGAVALGWLQPSDMADKDEED